jgi:hypothetical protein
MQEGTKQIAYGGYRFVGNMWHGACCEYPVVNGM